MKVSIDVHSDEVENNHQEYQIKCQKSKKSNILNTTTHFFARKMIIVMRKF